MSEEDTKINIQQLAHSLVQELFGSGTVAAFFTNDESEKHILVNAGKAFGVLHEILFGEFYQKYMHHGDCSSFKTPREAVEAYRAFIGDCIHEAGLDDLL